MSFLVSIIIPTSGEPRRRNTLREILSVISNQKVWQSFEILLIENSNSVKKRCSYLINQFPNLDIRYFKINKRSASLARNYGIKKSKGDFLILLDDDCIPQKSWFKTIGKLTSFSHNIVFQGKIIPKFKEKNIWTEIFLNIGNKFLEKQFQPWKPIEYLCAGNVFLRKETLKKLGHLFDVKLFPFVGEQEDFAHRLKRKGVIILYAPELVVDHIKEKKTIWNSLRREFLYGRRGGILVEKYPINPKIKRIIDEDSTISKLIRNGDKKERSEFNLFLRQETAKYPVFYKTYFLSCYFLLKLSKRIGLIFGKVYYKLSH